MSFLFPLVVLLAMLAMDFPGVSAQCSITGITGNTYTFSGIGVLSPGINPSGQAFSYTPCGSNSNCKTTPASTACTDSTTTAVPLNSASDPITFTFVNPLVPQLGVVATYPSLSYGGDTRSLSVLFACGPDGVGFAAFSLGNLQLVSGGSISLYAFVVPTSVICNFATTYPAPSTLNLSLPTSDDHLASSFTNSKLRKIISAIHGDNAA
jgi:hypothetical protein